MSIPTNEALHFLRWELNRWLGALESLRQHSSRLTPETGAMGTMLARVIYNICLDQQYGLPYDLYKSSWISKKGFKWRGLSFQDIVQASGMYWLPSSMIDWQTLLFHHTIQAELRFFLSHAKKTYTERRSQVSNAHQLYRGIDQIARVLGPGVYCEHQLERMRRICFLALTVQILQFDVKNQATRAPTNLSAYNYGICYSWLRQYYLTEFNIPQPWRVETVWKKSPSWAALLQQLFDWDDQDQYKIPFRRDRWDRIEFRLITRHAFDQIQERLGMESARKWKKTLGLYATRFFWMIPKCTGNRFTSMTKRTQINNGDKKRKNMMAWYSAVHSDIAHLPEDSEVPRKWNWKVQKHWDWEDCGIMKHPPQQLFTNLEDLDFDSL